MLNGALAPARRADCKSIVRVNYPHTCLRQALGGRLYPTTFPPPSKRAQAVCDIDTEGAMNKALRRQLMISGSLQHGAAQAGRNLRAAADAARSEQQAAGQQPDAKPPERRAVVSQPVRHNGINE